MNAVAGYFSALLEAWGNGWNRFWFTPVPARSLGLLRILVGAMALWVVASYSWDLDRLLGPQAIISPDIALEKTAEGVRGNVRFSLFLLCHNGASVRWAHGLCLAAIGMMTIGLFSRVASVAGLLAFLSYVHRAPIVTSELEPVLAFLMFYLCLGPSGAAFSVDALRRRRFDRTLETRHFHGANIAIRLIQLHVCLVFAMMAVAKLNGMAWLSGEAIWWLMARPESRLVDWTALLRNHPFVSNAWTHAIIGYELAFAVLIWNRWARPMLLVVGLPIWASLAVATGLPALAAVLYISTLSFLPPGLLRFAAPGTAGESPHEAATHRVATLPGSQH